MRFEKEDYRLTSQLAGSTVFMPSNIVEGSARTDRAFVNFLDISLGSSYKLRTQLIAAHHAKYISIKKYIELHDKNNEFQRMTIGFIEALLSLNSHVLSLVSLKKYLIKNLKLDYYGND